MEYVKVAKADEIGNGEKKKLEIEGKVIMLANIDGEYYALDNKCPHMGGSLYDGKFEDGKIVCPRHGAAFDVKTGKSIKGAKMAFVNIKVKDATAYPVKVADGDILVGIG
jgi:3-phenylpropionate/trans-cinnamate dioxygenase ferredoxin subunit